MKVLMTADTVGGVFTYALELARALGARGAQVDLATMGASLDAGQRAAAAAVEGVRVHESAFKLEWMEDPWDDVRRAGQWLLSLERRLGPDVVHLNGYAHGALAWRSPRVVVGHSCVLSWWRAVKGERAPASWDRYRSEVARGLAAADLVVAPSAAMLDALEEEYGLLPRATVIHNGRDPQAFAPAAKEEIVFSSGRLWDEAKNVGALDAVAADVGWPVYVAGERRHPNGADAQVTGAVALGRLAPPELARWLARASVYALPARYEPFGLSVLEAALSGCALVLGDIPSLRELWGEAALYVAPDDRRALARALQRLVADAELRESLAGRARARAATYSSDRMASAYLAAYAAAGDRLAGAGHAREQTTVADDRSPSFAP
jgi:glycosyltransferase involved in cell wall biosynthesis